MEPVPRGSEYHSSQRGAENTVERIVRSNRNSQQCNGVRVPIPRACCSMVAIVGAECRQECQLWEGEGFRWRLDVCYMNSYAFFVAGMEGRLDFIV